MSKLWLVAIMSIMREVGLVHEVTIDIEITLILYYNSWVRIIIAHTEFHVIKGEYYKSKPKKKYKRKSTMIE